MKVYFYYPWEGNGCDILEYEGFLNKGDFILLDDCKYQIMSVEIEHGELHVRLK